MPDGNEFHTVGAATLKPREAKVVRTRGTDSRLVFEVRKEHRELYCICRTGELAAHSQAPNFCSISSPTVYRRYFYNLH